VRFASNDDGESDIKMHEQDAGKIESLLEIYEGTELYKEQMFQSDGKGQCLIFSSK
jgi:hypothetical protein